MERESERGRKKKQRVSSYYHKETKKTKKIALPSWNLDDTLSLLVFLLLSQTFLLLCFSIEASFLSLLNNDLLVDFLCVRIHASLHAEVDHLPLSFFSSSAYDSLLQKKGRATKKVCTSTAPQKVILTKKNCTEVAIRDMRYHDYQLIVIA